MVGWLVCVREVSGADSASYTLSDGLQEFLVCAVNV